MYFELTFPQFLLYFLRFDYFLSSGSVVPCNTTGRVMCVWWKKEWQKSPPRQRRRGLWRRAGTRDGCPSPNSSLDHPPSPTSLGSYRTDIMNLHLRSLPFLSSLLLWWFVDQMLTSLRNDAKILVIGAGGLGCEVSIPVVYVPFTLSLPPLVALSPSLSRS